VEGAHGPHGLERETECRPSHAAGLEKRGKLHALITQKIDELHEMAGNSPAKVIEVHGSVRKVVCMDCDMTPPMKKALEVPGPPARRLPREWGSRRPEARGTQFVVLVTCRANVSLLR
jgi:hypothetical protein